MILKIPNGFLELTDEIEVERKVKLFEDFSTVDGDFSYSFTIPRTLQNEEKLKVYSSNNVLKPWAKKVPAELLDDDGLLIHVGFIRIENRLIHEYSVSFFSGNTNWIEELNFNLLDIDWSEYDPSGSYFFTETEGVVTPLTDRGMLQNRKTAMFSADDFQGYIYVKTAFQRILREVGMKITGDILKDPIYNKLITSAGTNKALQEEIDKREVFVGKSVNQTITDTYTNVVLPNVSDPYYNSDLGNWDTVTNRYTFDIAAKFITVEYKLIFTPSIVNYFDVRVLMNGTDTVFSKVYSKTKIIQDKIEYLPGVNIGDYFEIQVRKSSSFFTDRTMVANSWVKIYPTKFYKIFTQSIIPDMTATDFISNVFRMLNLMVVYNPTSKTITTKKFDSVLSDEPVDVSEYVTIQEDNFEEFISDYFKNNWLVWKDQSNDFVDQYNQSNILPYGAGSIPIDNDFLDSEGTILEMDFAAPWQQLYGFLGLELPLTDFGSTTVIETRDLTSVTQDSSGGDSVAVFHYSGSAIGRSVVIRISESSIEEYNGEYYAVSLSVAQFFAYTPYLGNATGKIEILEFVPSSSDPVFLLNNPGLEIGDISGVDVFYVGNLASRTTIAVANFLPTENFRGSLSFSDLIPIYFSGTSKLLNNGVKCFANGNIPNKVHRDIDFLRPIRVNESVYYLDRESGYKGSKFNVTLELIKK